MSPSRSKPPSRRTAAGRQPRKSSAAAAQRGEGGNARRPSLMLDSDTDARPPTPPAPTLATPPSDTPASDPGPAAAGGSGMPASAPHGTAEAAARRQRLATAAAQLGLALDEAALDRLLAYLGLLQRWNRVYNLTAVQDADAMLTQHLVDCLAALPPLRNWAGGRALKVLDVGSGGGLPGVVLAIVQPDWRIDCVDTVAKKATFIRQVSAELRLPNLRSLHARVETLPTSQHYDLITSRAFASLADFVALTEPLLDLDGAWAAMKGQPTPDELAAVPAHVDMFHVEPLQVPGLAARRCIVWMRPRR